jgi:hypothetical protein
MLNYSHTPISGAILGEIGHVETRVGFLAFAALALFVIFKAGESVDMGGEKHGNEANHEAEPAKGAPAADTPLAAAAPASK